MLPGVWAYRSQIDSPFPSSFQAPSIWYEDVATPHLNRSGNLRPAAVVDSIATAHIASSASGVPRLGLRPLATRLPRHQRRRLRNRVGWGSQTWRSNVPADSPTAGNSLNPASTRGIKEPAGAGRARACFSL